jgi:hypothetical protein
VTPRPLTLALFGLLGLAACGGGSGIGGVGGGGGGGPSNNLKKEIGLTADEEVNAALAALSVVNAGAPLGLGLPGGCPVPSNTTDGDADGILTDAILNHTDPPCHIAVDTGSVGITGELRVQDANAATDDDFSQTAIDLAWAYSSATPTLLWTSTRNGTRTRTGGTTSATELFDIITKRAKPGLATATIETVATLLYVADTAGTMTSVLQVPSGSFGITGTLHWKRSTEDYSFDISTPLPVHYDATCVTSRGLDAGTIQLDGTIGAQTGSLTVHWTGCGLDPTVVWTVTP